MASRRRRKKSEEGGFDPLSLTATLERHLEWMRVLAYSEQTVEGRSELLSRFIAWCAERSVHRPSEVTKSILERYQRHLYHYRQEDGRPLSFATQYAHIASLRGYFKWLSKQNLILFNPASELSVPKRSKELPKHVLSAAEVEQVLQLPDVDEPLGLRDRAILETFYSTGIRRTELVRLKLYDLDTERGVLMVRLGKGRKDRVVPIGDRALLWVDKYLRDSRPLLVMPTAADTLFLSKEGEAFSPDYLSRLVHSYIQAAGLGRAGGACHALRHSMATLMLEGGADIRFIQEILGHEELSSTQVYTRVSIRALKEVHTATHPARLQRSEAAKTAERDEEAAEREELLSSLAAESEEED